MQTSIWRHFDFWLLGAMSVLIILGVAMISSTIAGNIELIELDVVGRQIIYAGLGYLLIFLAASVDYHVYPPFGRAVYLVVGGLLVYILALGDASFGAARWINLGIASIQPSELAKLVVIIISAEFFSLHKDRIQELSIIIRGALVVAPLLLLIVIQPDLSTTITLGVLWFAILFATGLQWKHLGLFILTGLTVAIIAFPFLEDYQQRRVFNFLNPDPEETYGENYNVNQAIITIGSGGWTGKGYGQGTQVQLRYLKVRHIDFIFSSIGEELGFVGNALILILELFIIWRCLRAARLSYDAFGSLLCYGVATLIGFQAIINIGMNLQIMPVTGLPLPFVNYGGSALVTLMIGIGMVESVVARHKVLEFNA